MEIAPATNRIALSDSVGTKRVERARLKQHVRWHVARIKVIEPGESCGEEHRDRVFWRNRWEY